MLDRQPVLRIIEDMEERLKLWGQNVRYARKATGMTQIEFAEAVGVRQSSTCRWENGDCAPSDSHKIRIAQVLNRPVTTLFPLFAEAVG